MRIKLLFVALFLVVFSQKMAAQIIVNGVNINERPTVEFIELLLFYDVIGWRGQCHVDYGQYDNWKNRKPTELTDSNGQVVKLTSRMSALNYFFHNGWEPIFSDRLNDSNGVIVMRRRAEKNE